jgi:eukaryotic-like serine/threonine-protein kinase
VQLDPGARIAHYHIVAALGAGGMGEVYRATDTRLGRDVALKVLPADVSASTERLERFQREARALAALDHPGIVTVYSVEEHEGVQFLTMQLVDGEQLDRVIPEDGLPLERVIAIATALAEALAAAHDKGIVHRDLKPANVMIAKDGRVKVLDFGLARVTQQEPSGDSELPTHLRTREGVVMGTAHSPAAITQVGTIRNFTVLSFVGRPREPRSSSLKTWRISAQSSCSSSGLRAWVKVHFATRPPDSRATTSPVLK